MSSSKPALVARMLADRIRAGVYRSGDPFPALSTMAFELGVSYLTAQRAYAILVRDGALRRVAGKRGFFVGPTGASDVAGPGPTPLPRHREIARALSDQIASGQYQASGRLPSPSQLAAQYGCGARTLRKALHLLLDEKMITRQGRHYPLRYCRQPGTADLSRPCFVAYRKAFVSYRDHLQNLLLAVDRMRQNYGWPPPYFCLIEPGRVPRLPPRHRVSGLLLITGAGSTGGTMRMVRQHFRECPLVVIDPPSEVSRSLVASSEVYWIHPDQEQAGRDMGLHLKRLGHRHIAVFCHDYTAATSWAQGRVAGLQEVFAPVEGGPSLSCTGFVVPFRATADRYRTTVDRAVSLLPADTPPSLAGEFQERYREFLVAQQLAGECQAFGDALRNREIRAWVCVNDGLAEVARDYLSKRHVRVPSDLSLASFDNNSLSAHSDTTSYDFAFDKMGYMAIRVMSAPHLARARDDRVIKVSGNLILRGSTAPPSADRRRTALNAGV